VKMKIQNNVKFDSNFSIKLQRNWQILYIK